MQLSEEDLAPYLAKVGDRALRHALEYGVAFLHETQPPAEQEVVNLLFNTGAIQVGLPSLHFLHALYHVPASTSQDSLAMGDGKLRYMSYSTEKLFSTV